MLLFVASNSVVAQDQPAATTTAVDSSGTAAADEAVAADPVEEVAAKAEEGQSLHSALKQKFIEGGPIWMTPILICLVLGLAFCIERIIYLNLSTSNTKSCWVRLKMHSTMVELKLPKKYAQYQGARWPVFFIRDWTDHTKVWIWLKNQWSLMAGCRPVCWKKT